MNLMRYITAFVVLIFSSSIYALDFNLEKVVTDIAKEAIKSKSNQKPNDPPSQANQTTETSTPDIAINNSDSTSTPKDYAPVGFYVRFGASDFVSNYTGNYGTMNKGNYIGIKVYVPTGLETGDVFRDFVKSNLALRKTCETQSSPYYKVLGYKDNVKTKRLANGKNLTEQEFWANVENVGNSECAGWFLAKRTPTDTLGDQVFQHGFSSRHEFEEKMCPSGWKVGKVTQGATPVYNSTFECFAPIGTLISKTYFCSGFGYMGYQQLYNIHERSQAAGVLTCASGVELLNKNKMQAAEEEIELRRKIQKQQSTLV